MLYRYNIPIEMSRVLDGCIVYTNLYRFNNGIICYIIFISVCVIYRWVYTLNKKIFQQSKKWSALELKYLYIVGGYFVAKINFTCTVQVKTE